MPKILIVDDCPDDREWLSELVRRSGDFTIQSVRSGAEGLALIKQHGADCVLLDNRLDGEDGLAVLNELRTNRLFTPVIMLTGEHCTDLATAAAQAGACRFVAKANLDSINLGDAIRNAIRGSQKERKEIGAQDIAKHVILVEDNADDREYIANMIADGNQGVTVEAVATGTEALSFLEAYGTDCVILDYRLEAEDGLDILAALKEITPFVPVIMLTGQGNEEVAAQSIKVGAADYLVKQRLNETYLRTAIENAISRSALEARVADQDVERRQFLNILVHDLRQPLQNVRTLGEMAKEELEEGNTKELVDLLASQAKVATRADELIKTLESYAILDREVQFATVSLTEIAKAAADNLATEISERQANVVIRDMPTLQGNAWQLMQLFQNLIGNGLKYNDSESPQIIIECETAEEVNIVVKDNGIGIPAKHIKTIFAPLKRLWSQSQYEGTGLGLATCQKIVQRHNGLIWCTSVEGKGSNFHIRFSTPS